MPIVPTILILGPDDRLQRVNLADYDPARDLCLEEIEAADRVLAGQSDAQLRAMARSLGCTAKEVRGLERQALVIAICKARKERQ